MGSSHNRALYKCPITLTLILIDSHWRTRRSMGGQGDISPILFEVEGTPCVLSPTFSGVDISVLMHTVFIG